MALRPVDFDPFAPRPSSGRLTPVDFDPFAPKPDDRNYLGMNAYGGGANDVARIAPTEPKLPDPTKPEDTFFQFGKKAIENLKPWAEMAYGGAARALGEAGSNTPIFSGIDPAAMQRTQVELQKRGLGSGVVTEDVNTDWASDNAVSQYGKKIYEAAEQDLKENAPNVDPNSVKGIAYDAITALAQNIPALIVGITTRNPALATGAFVAPVVSQQYGEARSEGMSPQAASAESVYYGLTEWATEHPVFESLLKPGVGFMKRTLRAMGLEGVGEAVNQVLQQGYESEKLSEQSGIPFNEAWDKLGGWTSVARAAGIGAVVGGKMSAITEGAEAYQRRGLSSEQFNAVAGIRDIVENSNFSQEGIARDVIRAMDPNSYDPSLIDPRQYRGVVKAPGIIESAASAVQPTQEDIESPLDTDTILAGRKVMAEAAALPEANAILKQAGISDIGSGIELTFPDGRVLKGSVKDAFRIKDESLGVNEDGVKITLDDGTEYEEYLSTLRESGVAIRSVGASPSPKAVETPAAAPADLANTTVDAATGATVGPVAQPVTTPQATQEDDPERALQRRASEIYSSPTNTRTRAEIVAELRNQQEQDNDVRQVQEEASKADAQGQASQTGNANEGPGNTADGGQGQADAQENDGVLTPQEIHKAADEREIAWDEAPAFMARTKELTGKERLDELTTAELRLVHDDLVANTNAWKPKSTPGKRVGTDAVAKMISKKTGGKGVRVYRYGERNEYDPLLGAVLIRDDNINVKSAAKAALAEAPKGWRKAQVTVTLEDGTRETEEAGRMADAIKGRIERANALLDCVAG